MIPTGPASSAQPVFGSATAVLELAVSGRWRSPETTAALADHAVLQARTQGDGSCALLAEGWLLHGLALVGRGPAAVTRAVAALGDAVRGGHRPAEGRLRVGLAAVARELGDQDSARALLGPVLNSDIDDPELAADAHIEAVRGGGPDLLAAVDLAAGHIRRLRGEQVGLGLAALDAALANRYRTDGSPAAAAARAREGLRRLLGHAGTGSELDPISPHIAAWLSLELTLALLDDGQTDLARRVAEPALAWSGRPAALVPLTRLRLTLAQRAYLPVGENEAALRSVAWAAGVVGEQDLPGLEADCQSLLAEVQEQRGALPDALTAIRRAHQALRVHSLRVEQALVLLGRSAGDPRRSPVPAAGTRPEGLPPAGPRRDGQTLGLPVVQASRRPGAPPPGPPAPDRKGISGSGGVAGSTVRLPIVPRRPADLGADDLGPAELGADELALPRHSNGAPPGEHRPGVAADEVGDGWSGLTGRPSEIRAESPGSAAGAWPAVDHIGRSGMADALTVTTRDQLSAVGPEALGWAEAGGWAETGVRADAPGCAPSTPPPADRQGGSEPVERAGAESLGFLSTPGVEQVGLPMDDFDLSTAGSSPPSEDAPPLPEAVEAPAGSELDELFEPGEGRPLGLVALDVATPTGPLTGEAVRSLLQRVAEHVQDQLPPNSRLAVLARDVVLVVLPPVEPEVVARWMRSVAGGLSARWSDYAADVPRSAFRVAVGALEPGLTPAETVAHLCDRLGRHATPAAGSVGGGRHVARARGSVEMNAGATPTVSGSGGRRRRPENAAAPGPADITRAAPPLPAADPSAPQEPTGSSGNGHGPVACTNGVPHGAADLGDRLDGGSPVDPDGAPQPILSRSGFDGVPSRPAGLDPAVGAAPASHPSTERGAVRAGSELGRGSVGLRARVTDSTFYAAATERIVLAAALATALTARSEATGPRPGSATASGGPVSGAAAASEEASGIGMGESVLDAATKVKVPIAEPAADATRSSSSTPAIAVEPDVAESGAPQPPAPAVVGQPDAPAGATEPSRPADPVRAHVPTAELSFGDLLAGALAAYRDG